MSKRLIPAYVERAGWEVWNAYQAFLEDDDLDRLRDAVGGIRDALLRGEAVRYAPDDVIEEWLTSGAAGPSGGNQPLPEELTAMDEWVLLFANRNEMADVYADLLRIREPTWGVWPILNLAIIDRWSMAGLRYIKARAWRLARAESERTA